MAGETPVSLASSKTATNDARRSIRAERKKTMKTYTAVAQYSNRAGGRMSSGPYTSRARAEEAAIAMTAKGYEDVKIYTATEDDAE